MSQNRSDTTAPGDMTKERMAVVQTEWRAASQQIAHHVAEQARWKRRYDELGKELLALEAHFPVDWS